MVMLIGLLASTLRARLKYAGKDGDIPHYCVLRDHEVAGVNLIQEAKS